MSTLPAPAPFIKWCGGKRQLLPVLLPMLPENFGQYHEPFVGGGAMFFELYRLGRLNSANVYLADTNLRLMNCYKAVRDDVESVILQLEDLGKNTSEIGFFAARKEFNRGREKEDQEMLFNPEPPSPPRLAALFIYIIRLCFNGLYRENRDGAFNVGYCKNPDQFSVRPDELRAAARALQGTILQRSRFERCVENTAKDDLIFFDPPYLGTFEAYISDGFGLTAHTRLSSICRELDRGGVRWLLANNDNAQVRKLWKDFNLEGTEERRAVNSDGEERNNVPCLLIRNY